MCMLGFRRSLEGELDGTFDPRRYGFDVIQAKPLSQEEEDLRVASLYRDARAISGLVIPVLEKYLTLQPYDPESAHDLLRKYEDQAYPLTCQFGRAKLEIDEGVFSPSFTSASPFLFREINFGHSGRMLDAFAGSGAFGINAAMYGLDAVAYDISPEAVDCIKKNVLLNNVAEHVEVRLGAVNCVAPDEEFDLIIANPPLIPLSPENGLESTLFDPGLQATKEFVAALPRLLSTKGHCYLLTSDVIDRKSYECDIASLCTKAGLKMLIVAQLHKKYESYRVHKIEHRRWPHFRSLLSQI